MIKFAKSVAFIGGAAILLLTGSVCQSRGAADKIVHDAEYYILEKQNEADGPTFKIKDDPRITRVGKTLRKSGLDELPQLFNVLVGVMSLIGPRPPLEKEVLQCERSGHGRERYR